MTIRSPFLLPIRSGHASRRAQAALLPRPGLHFAEGDPSLSWGRSSSKSRSPPPAGRSYSGEAVPERGGWQNGATTIVQNELGTSGFRVGEGRSRFSASAAGQYSRSEAPPIEKEEKDCGLAGISPSDVTHRFHAQTHREGRATKLSGVQ